MMNKFSVKQTVVERYGQLAKSSKNQVFSKLFACCDPNGHVRQIGKSIGYSESEMASVPEESNLGVGCGNPSAFAKINQGDTVVDLGSGAGFDSFVIAPLVAEEGQVIGIDLSEDMLTLARKNAAKNGYGNVKFIKGDIEKLPLDSDIADRVISNCVINLSLNKADVFAEAFRVLKPGGRLAISDIVLERELPDFIKNSLEGHVACISGAEILEDYLKYISDAGFSEITIEKVNTFPLELMMHDPHIQKLAKTTNFDFTSEEARDISSRVKSISLTAVK